MGDPLATGRPPETPPRAAMVRASDDKATGQQVEPRCSSRPRRGRPIMTYMCGRDKQLHRWWAVRLGGAISGEYIALQPAELR